MATRQQQLSAIMTAESGGKNVYNYRYNENPNYYTASGYYQFTNTTWKQGAQWAGVDTSQYPTAISAPYSVQTQVANSVLDHSGMQPWSGSKANTLLSQIDSGQNVNLITSPVDSGAGTTGGQNDTLASGTTEAAGFGSNGSDPNTITDPTTGEPIGGGNTIGTGVGGAGGVGSNLGLDTGYIPPAQSGGPYTFGLATGVVNSINSWISSVETAIGNRVTTFITGLFGTVENWAIRLGLIILAVFLILIALWRLMDPTGEKTRRVMSGAMMAA